MEFLVRRPPRKILRCVDNRNVILDREAIGLKQAPIAARLHDVVALRASKLFPVAGLHRLDFDGDVASAIAKNDVGITDDSVVMVVESEFVIAVEMAVAARAFELAARLVTGTMGIAAATFPDA